MWALIGQEPYFYNCMKTAERFTPLYAIAYTILNSIENLPSDKEGYSYILVFYRLFNKRNRKHFFPRVPIETFPLETLFENSK